MQKDPLLPGWGLYLGTTDIWGWIILCSGDCPVHCRMFSGIPDLYPLDDSSTI